MSHRPLPQAIDAERGLLGSILLAPDRVLGECIRRGVGAKTFHHPAHARVFATVVEMREAGRPIDLITLTQYLEDQHRLDEVGGAAAITDLFTAVPTASNASYYLDILREKQILRDLIATCSEYAARAFLEHDNPDGLSSEAQAALSRIINSTTTKNTVTRSTLLTAYLNDKEDLATGRSQPQILPTPFPAINARVGGYHAGEVTLIMGPTNSGKSLLGMEHILLACLDQGHPSAVFTGEMPFRQYMNRVVSNRARISSKNLRTARLDTGEHRRFLALCETLVTAPLEIYDQNRNPLTLESIEAEIRHLHRTQNLRVVLVDYLQRLNLPRRKDIRRDEEVGMVTTLFKRLAVELDLWIFILSATNDEGQVKESRGPEFDADNILSVMTNKEKVTKKVFISKWRDGEKSYYVDVEIEGDFCAFREQGC